jgi:hypothetical protein
LPAEPKLREARWVPSILRASLPSGLPVPAGSIFGSIAAPASGSRRDLHRHGIAAVRFRSLQVPFRRRHRCRPHPVSCRVPRRASLPGSVPFGSPPGHRCPSRSPPPPIEAWASPAAGSRFLPARGRSGSAGLSGKVGAAPAFAFASRFFPHRPAAAALSHSALAGLLASRRRCSRPELSSVRGSRPSLPAAPGHEVKLSCFPSRAKRNPPVDNKDNGDRSSRPKRPREAGSVGPRCGRRATSRGGTRFAPHAPQRAAAERRASGDRPRGPAAAGGDTEGN